MKHVEADAYIRFIVLIDLVRLYPYYFFCIVSPCWIDIAAKRLFGTISATPSVILIPPKYY